MNHLIHFFSIALFSIFVGSQITEGLLLVPYWKSLPMEEFYDYYTKFGPPIGRFYSILTIIAVIIPVFYSIYCVRTKATAFNYSLISTFFGLLVIAVFYLYFKGTNQEFYESTLSASQLKSALSSWQMWHWIRIVFELIALTFLILAINSLNKAQNSIT